MKYKMAKFSVKRENLSVAIAAIEEFVSQVKKHEQDTLKYESYQTMEKNEFVHFMCFKDEQAEQHHRNASYTKKFVEVLYPLCEKLPLFTDIKPVE